MLTMIFTGSPNINGLTAACGAAAEQGATGTGSEILTVNLNSYNIGKCNACGNGWGPCRTEYRCQVLDDFQKVHESISFSDARCC